VHHTFVTSVAVLECTQHSFLEFLSYKVSGYKKNYIDIIPQMFEEF